MIIGSFCIVDHGCSAVQFFMDFCDYLVRIIGHNHGLHAFLLGKDRVCHTTGDKDGNHGVESVFPTKGQSCYQHDGSIYQERNTTDISPCFLSNSETDDICTSARNIVTSAKPIPKPMTTPPKKGIDDGILCQGHNWHKLDKEELMDTVIKVKIVNLCPI